MNLDDMNVSEADIPARIQSQRGPIRGGAAEMDDFVAFLWNKAAWSERTFGPGARTRGICQHVRKELAEIEADPLDLMEWVDVFMLATDGFWRAYLAKHPTHNKLKAATHFVYLIQEKQRINEGRTWPPPKSEDEAIEHVRDGE